MVAPLNERESKIHSAKLLAEINSVGDEVSKIWKIIGELEGGTKTGSTALASDDPASYGELAKAMNAMLHDNESGKKGATGPTR